MSNVTRRGFLSGTTGALAAGTAATLIATKTEAASHMAASGQTQDLTLSAEWIETTLDGYPVKLRGWNGMVPGPMITARPGDRLNIEVVNNLTPYDSSNWGGNHNVPHDLNSTNLHVHGLEVMPHLFEPLGTKDPHAPMIVVPPEGGRKAYSFDIPSDQPPGLFWYHPHKHGSTAVQAVSGMAGPIIIHGNIDEVPEIAAAQDILLAVQDIGLFLTDNPDKDGEGTYIYEPVQNAIWQTFSSDEDGNPIPRKVTIDGVWQKDLKGGFTTGDYELRFFLVNGQPVFKEVHNPQDPTNPTGTQLDVPVISLAPGEVARLRMLNGNSDDVMPIYLEDHDLHLIGMDGVNLPALRTLPKISEDGPATDHQLLLAPANRGEFLVKASMTPGTYLLRQAPQSLQFLKSEGRILAKIVVSGAAKDMALPQALPVQSRHYPLIPDSEVSKTRVFEFGMQFPGKANPTVGIDFFLNNQLYEELSVATTVHLNAVEDWVISAPPMPPTMPMADGATPPPGHFDNTEGHPFHIHVNSFEVIAIADVDAHGVASNEHRFSPDEVLIQDTIWVPMGKQVTIRQKYKQWTGKAVFHCHILPHEDTGMMQNFNILETAGHHGHGGHSKAKKG